MLFLTKKKITCFHGSCFISLRVFSRFPPFAISRRLPANASFCRPRRWKSLFPAGEGGSDGYTLKAAVPDEDATEALAGGLRKHKGTRNAGKSPSGWNNFSKRHVHFRSITTFLLFASVRGRGRGRGYATQRTTTPRPPPPLSSLCKKVRTRGRSPPHKRFLVSWIGCSSPFMRLAEHLTALRAWC